MSFFLPLTHTAKDIDFYSHDSSTFRPVYILLSPLQRSVFMAEPNRRFPAYSLRTSPCIHVPDVPEDPLPHSDSDSLRKPCSPQDRSGNYGPSNRSERRTCCCCGHCSSVCPKGIPIHRYLFLRRTDFHDNRILSANRSVYLELCRQSVSPAACIRCGQCEGICPRGVPIVDLLRKTVDTLSPLLK